MGARPPITIVTSTYNWPSALSQAIPTALAQTFSDFEYLIVGDGCTDETESVVRGFNDPRIVWRNLPANSGNQSDVNRVALEWARGEFIAYLNHDDLWFPDHLETLIAPLLANDFDMIHSLCIEVSPPGHHHRGILGLPHSDADGVHFAMPMTTTVLHTAAAAREVGGWTNWRETTEVPTHHFFRKLFKLRHAFGVVPHITALKFHSGDRLNSYSLKDGSEQARFASLIAGDPSLRYREAMVALACGCLGETSPKLAQPSIPSNPLPGWQIEQWRRMRGLPPMISLGTNEPGEIKPLPAARPSFLEPNDGGFALIRSKPTLTR